MVKIISIYLKIDNFYVIFQYYLKPIFPDMDLPALPAAFAPSVKPSIGADTILGIVRESLQGWNWNKNTDKDMIARIRSIAAKYDTTFEAMQQASIALAKHESDNMAISKYEFIKMGEDSYEFKARTNPELMISYAKASFIIWIDRNNNIWVVYRVKLSRRTIDDLFSPTAMQLISCLGMVYFHYYLDRDFEIPPLPDNIIQISFIYQPRFTRLPQYLLGFGSTCRFESYIHLPMKPLKYLTMAGSDTTQLERISPGTEHITINYISDGSGNSSLGHFKDYGMLPYGLKKLTIDTIFQDEFRNLPPTIEECYINVLYSQLNGFPTALKKLSIDGVYSYSKCSGSNTEYKYPEIKPELILTNGQCDEDYDHTWGYYTFNNIEFLEGFEQLEIYYINTEEILPAIITVPKSFTKLIINFKTKYSMITKKQYFKNIVYKETDNPYTDEYMKYVEATKELYLKTILDTFSTRFPQIIIEEINK